MASGCGAANIAAHFVLADSGCAAPFVPAVAAAFREHCCGESGSHYLLFLEEDCDPSHERLVGVEWRVRAANSPCPPVVVLLKKSGPHPS